MRTAAIPPDNSAAVAQHAAVSESAAATPVREQHMTKPRIAVIGAGLMGHGIAQVFALAGHEVNVTDTVMKNLESLERRIAANLRDLGDDESALARVRSCVDLSEAVYGVDYVVEAVFEDLALKQKLFAEIENHVRADTILASNTSVIPITSIVQGLKHRERALGTHWWNPPFLLQLVEVIETQWTSPETVAWTMDLHRVAGKQPAHVKKDVPGFIGNRLQHALWREAIALVEHGICDAETVDAVIKASFGPRLAVLGPLENADLVGTDLTLAVHDTVLPAIESRPGASPYLQGLVVAGKLGFKSGEGFRKWSQEEQSALRAKLMAHLKAARDREKSQ
jgi:3-hydroxybutyryl-CoA dehydrogenase